MPCDRARAMTRRKSRPLAIICSSWRATHCPACGANRSGQVSRNVLSTCRYTAAGLGNRVFAFGFRWVERAIDTCLSLFIWPAIWADSIKHRRTGTPIAAFDPSMSAVAQLRGARVSPTMVCVALSFPPRLANDPRRCRDPLRTKRLCCRWPGRGLSRRRKASRD